MVVARETIGWGDVSDCGNSEQFPVVACVCLWVTKIQVVSNPPVSVELVVVC